MKEENRNVGVYKYCYGCGVCAVVCSKKAITMQLSDDGFYHPQIDGFLCVGCGKCIDVCSFSSDDVLLSEHEIKGFAGWSLSDGVRKMCSSGGVVYELEKQFLGDYIDGKVIAVRYNTEKRRAEHYISDSISKLHDSIGSKYIQSYTLDGFESIKNKGPFLIVGTPCQIDSLRRYLTRFNKGKDVFLVDFFCHGIPSYLFWEKYLHFLEGKLGRIYEVSWRDKSIGWHNSWVMTAKGDEGTFVSLKKDGDPFYQLFLGNNCLGEACYGKCKFKGVSSAADIRVGDFWGNTYRQNEDGVNSIIAFTDKGETFLQQTKSIQLFHQTLETVLEGQICKQIKYPRIARLFLFYMVKNNYPLQLMVFVNKVFNKARSLMK